MTDASTVGRFWDCVALVLWLPDEMGSWFRGREMCRVIYVQRWCRSVRALE